MEPRGQQIPEIMHGGMRRGRELSFAGFGLVLPDVPRPATSPSVFANDAPLELEVGSGKGTFLITESKARPEVNFLGIEYARRYWRYAADRLRRNACQNARIVLADATAFIRDYLKDESLSSVHVYFPDPWPKSRHHKRRFVQPDRIELVARKMRRGARLQIVTDHSEYFEQIRDVVRSSSLSVVDFGATAAAGTDEIVGSNFERKYRRQGRTFHVIASERV